MNNFIFYPIVILLVIGSFSQIYNLTDSEDIDLSYDSTYTQNLTGNQTLDGSESELELDEGSLSLGFDMTVGLIGLIAGAIALGLIGLNIVGSGLSDKSVSIIWNGIVFYGAWAVTSIWGFTAILSLPYFSVLFWFILTLVYTLGVFSRMGSDE